MQQPSSNRLEDWVDFAQCLVDEGQGTGYIAAGVGGARGPLEHLHAIHPGPCLGIGDPVPRLQRPPIVVERLGVGIDAVRLCSSPDRPLQRIWQVARPVPVHGDLGRRAGPVQLTRTEQVGDGVGQGGMQPCPLAGQQVSVHDFTDQGVPDIVAVPAGPCYQ